MPKSSGRFPFTAVANQYLKALENHRAKTTLTQLARDLRTIELDVAELHAKGDVATTNPRKMTVQDIAAIIGFWRVRPKRGPNSRYTGGTLDPTSQTHLWRALKGLLEYVGNGATGQLKTMPHVEIPHVLDKTIDTLSDSQSQRLRAAADTLCGYRGDVARFVVDFDPGTGLRAKEIRLQELACIDLKAMSGRVCHPKGEGRYATAHRELFVIDASAERALREFLPARDRFLDGERSDLLLPFRDRTGRLTGPWPESSLRKLVADLRRVSGVRFSLQEFRATFAQRAIDSGASEQATSRMMRHKTTVTLNRYYARMRPDPAMQEVRAALNRRELVGVQSPVH